MFCRVRFSAPVIHPACEEISDALKGTLRKLRRRDVFHLAEELRIERRIEGLLRVTEGAEAWPDFAHRLNIYPCMLDACIFASFGVRTENDAAMTSTVENRT